MNAAVKIVCVTVADVAMVTRSLTEWQRQSRCSKNHTVYSP